MKFVPTGDPLKTLKRDFETLKSHISIYLFIYFFIASAKSNICSGYVRFEGLVPLNSWKAYAFQLSKQW